MRPATDDDFVGVRTKVKFLGHCLGQDTVKFTLKKAVDIYNVYEINLWSFKQGGDFMLENYLFFLTKKADFDKHKYSGYAIKFDARGSFSQSDDNRLGKNVIIFGADMNSSGHIDNRKKRILFLGKGTTQCLDDTTFKAEKAMI